MQTSPETSVSNTSSLDVQLPAELRWHVHPARRRPAALLLVVLLIAAAGFGVQAWANSVWAGIVSGLVLCISLSRFFFPTRFELNREGAEVSTPFSRKQLRWQDVRWCGYDEHAVFLSQQRTDSLWDLYRAVQLHFCGNAVEAMTFIRAQVGRDVPVRKKRVAQTPTTPPSLRDSKEV